MKKVYYPFLSLIMIFFLPGCYTMVGSVNESEDSYTNNTTKEYIDEDDSEDLQYSEYAAAGAGYFDEEDELNEETEIVNNESNESFLYTISEALNTFISSGGLDIIINLSSDRSEENSSYEKNGSSERNNSGSRNYSGRGK